jgi:hypothetical protein
MTRRRSAISLLQATQESPNLARLAGIAMESSLRLKAVEFIIPAGLRQAVKPGPIEGGVWCVLLESNAVAAKLRQLLPAIEAQLKAKGFETTSIRLKVLSQQTHSSHS